MSMEFLRAIAEQKLPYVIHTPADIDRVRVLRAAELVTAFIPPSDRAPDVRAIQQLAQVESITAKGRLALNKATSAFIEL
ncbi:hypothetical protein ABL840_11865 [Variovorax sp. NFACC27]|mgnify:FL=1|jgi:hypothetical protein|uniref:Uncharacterized protein n=1 Tax=Variovorax gossypii TaxID=1679495 RepID=A0A3S0J2I7_9BURK|nr:MULTISPECIES: hypothetical protein [Variovorax]MDP9606672.1 hypothetical protein [Variovorax paradoxus]SEF25056.1 hypothetical protein SAMN03159371_01832 [Variovorax sp. NFACC28]SEG33252.1 hypothetical protein SAMN03159365_01913 [Variovorax sp. NFACC29]SFC38325.1 hypothetical protein SAMN03159379_02088 [Variovorax sp. NFACC26]SFF89237.1 hypothetical protein SAMN03159447_00664 [Variovorax sp. NFACC27]